MHERYFDVPDPIERENLATFVGRAIRLDDAAVVRFRQRPDNRVGAWTTTGFDALAVRVIEGVVRPNDTTAAADALSRNLSELHSGSRIDLGYSMDSSWRGALPPDKGFVHVDDVPARVLLDLAQRGAALAKEHGSNQGPPVSLLDQEVLAVEGGGEQFGVSMRMVFALTAMGFIPHTGQEQMTAGLDLDRIDADELVRVRASKSWMRLDARYGSVLKHRGTGLQFA